MSAVVLLAPAWGQLISPGSSVPRREKPPVIFLNGYQNDCAGVTFDATFAQADRVLEADGRVSLFFNNCDHGDKPLIETLGVEFGRFLQNLQYDDGQPVDRVDLVAHSMGGLIVRSYLSGKRETPGSFDPPGVVPIRKAVFFATPHFGTQLVMQLRPFFGTNQQVDEMASGSRFLFELATWNQDTDDLRGIDALSVLGNLGTGLATGTETFDDGVVALTSGSLGWVMPGRTRVIPYCHSSGFPLICPQGSPSIVAMSNTTELPARILLSFLNGTDDWRTLGTAPEDNPFLTAYGGLLASVRDASDDALPVTSITAKPTAGTQAVLKGATALRYLEQLSSGTLSITATSGTATITRQLDLAPGVYRAIVIKPGPRIDRIYPSAAAVFPLAVAPGMFASVYGDALASRADEATTIDYPNILADAQVLINGAPAALHYAGPTQINAVIPDDASGLAKLEVRNGAGSHTVNVLVEKAVPAVFTQNASGSGPASALNTQNQLVTATNPLRPGDYLQLYLTGLGATETRDGLEWARQQPAVTVDGLDCAVTYAGRAPGFRGLDQINCVVPAGLARNPAAAVVVTSGTRASTTSTVAVEP